MIILEEKISSWLKYIFFGWPHYSLTILFHTFRSRKNILVSLDWFLIKFVRMGSYNWVEKIPKWIGSRSRTEFTFSLVRSKKWRNIFSNKSIPKTKYFEQVKINLLLEKSRFSEYTNIEPIFMKYKIQALPHWVFKYLIFLWIQCYDTIVNPQ